MTLPTFLGIGAPRSGSTWLYTLLSTHPDVYVPPKRKDVRYFNSYYDRGIDWYESFFPGIYEDRSYSAIGEFTPDYLYHNYCAKRISSILATCRLILILRNPTDRLFSKYKDVIVNKNYKGSFEHFIQQFPDQKEQGLYCRFINNYLDYFDKNQILVLIFEESIRELDMTKNELARFLGIAATDFPKDAGIQKVNASIIPRRAASYSLAFSVSSFLRHQCRLDRFVDWYLHFGRKLGVKKFFGESGKSLEIKKSTRTYLDNYYQNEINKLEKLIGRELSCWR